MQPRLPAELVPQARPVHNPQDRTSGLSGQCRLLSDEQSKGAIVERAGVRDDPRPCGAEGSGGAGARPGARERFIRTSEDQLKKNLPIAPLLSAASLCLFPMAVSAQTPSAPSAPETSTQASMPSAPSIPEAPSIPTSPSQPSGYPRPTNYWPGATFEPAGTQSSTVSAGQEAPAFQLRALGGFEHQGNVLGSSSNEQSDTVGYAGVGLRADRRYGLQRFRADVEANTYRYNNRSELDYSVFNYALAWDWSVTTKLARRGQRQPEAVPGNHRRPGHSDQPRRQAHRTGPGRRRDLRARRRLAPAGWLRAYGIEQHASRPPMTRARR